MSSRPRSADAALGLLLSCHPLPCVAVTAFATAYAAAMNGPAGRLAGVAAAVLSGQLCVGWSNDAIDAPRDRIARRADKPISSGLIARRPVLIAAVLAAIACVVLSFRLGAEVGWLHVAAVTSAVGYNAWLKSTWASPLPYLFSFGALPVLVSFAVTGPVDPSRPPLSHIVAAALLGGAAHAGNTVGDTEADAATGVRGLPQRLGPQRSLIAMAVLVAAAAIVMLVTVLTGDQAGGGRRLVAGVLLGGGVLLAFVGALRRVGVPGGRDAFRLTLGAVTLVIAGFLAAVQHPARPTLPPSSGNRGYSDTQKVAGAHGSTVTGDFCVPEWPLCGQPWLPGCSSTLVQPSSRLSNRS
jgi:heme o synthase